MPTVDQEAEKQEHPSRVRLWLFDLELAWVRFRRRPVRTLVGTWAVIVAVAAVTFILSLGDGLHEYLSRRLQAFTPALWVEAPASQEGAFLEPPSGRDQTPGPQGAPPNGELIDGEPSGRGERSKAASSAPEAAGVDAGSLGRTLREHPGVSAVSPHVALPVLLMSGRTALPARLEGYDPAALASVLPGFREALQGRAPSAAGEAALGTQLAAQLGLALGGTVLATSPDGRSVTLTVVGTFHAGLATVDSQLVITDLETANSMSGPGTRRGYALAVEPGTDLAALRLSLQKATGSWVQPWYEGRSSLLEALAVERHVMLWISLAAVATAAFATASVTALRVMEQRSELAILQAVGAGFFNTLRTVLAESLTSALAGAVLGAALGAAAGWALSRYPVALPPQFGLAYLPVRPRLHHAVFAVLIVLASTAAASLGPALRAARLDPAAVLREE